uniref:YqaJ viral recombinase domain-containing protein n=1 Tax=viral metagenome TaxID=1070528 RepID=A0A6C0JF39_9ZZZZ
MNANTNANIHINNLNDFNQLNDLENILDSLIFEDEIIPNIFDENNTLELIESALYLMEDYMNENPTAISEPDFEEEFLEDIKELFYIQFEEEILQNDWVEDDLEDILEEAFKIFIGMFCPERSISNNVILCKKEYDDGNDNYTNTDNSNKIQMDKNVKIKQILDKIEHIKQKPQPTQRTDEWYTFRHNLITASNAYKAFESQSTINQLIYEKCQPLKKREDSDNNNVNITTLNMVNINTPFHWGQKYEPLSVMLYEYLYNTTVADFGCIKHDYYHFLGASPDGINVDVNSERFGRMLEIKNIVNREINGIPKKEYWIQMQLQMEVCDLDDCDFLETKFVEYESANQFFKELESDLESETKSENITVLGKKGVIIYFHNISEAKPFYLYKPLNIVKMDEILKWEEEMIELYQSPQYNMTYIKSNYWKLEKLSCVLVLRNKNWFKNNIQAIENVWNIIEKERVTGYEHRAPNRKPKIKSHHINDINSGLCLIKLDK